MGTGMVADDIEKELLKKSPLRNGLGSMDSNV